MRPFRFFPFLESCRSRRLVWLLSDGFGLSARKSVNKTCLYHNAKQYNPLIPGSIFVDSDSLYAFGINIARSLQQISKNGTIISNFLSRTHVSLFETHTHTHTHTHTRARARARARSLIKQNQHFCLRLSFFRNFLISFTATLPSFASH